MLTQWFDKTLFWEDTYKAMADEKENWDDFDITFLDGLDDEEAVFRSGVQIKRQR